MKKTEKIKKFVNSLKNPPAFTNKKYNNPWNTQINCENLIKFLERDNIKYILIGEAPGRKGCLQCGVPFCDDYTLEDIIGVKKNKKSKETSAQRIYYFFGKDFISWNAFPYQPAKEDGNNRPPEADELKFGLEILEQFLNIFYSKEKTIILLGDKAKKSFEKLQEKYPNSIQLLHPACRADIKREKLGYCRGKSGWLQYVENELNKV